MRRIPKTDFQRYDHSSGPKETISQDRHSDSTCALCATFRGFTSPRRLGCVWKYQKHFSQTLQMAARALDNHRTPPSFLFFLPAKRGTLMSLLQDQCRSCSNQLAHKLFKHNHTQGRQTWAVHCTPIHTGEMLKYKIAEILDWLPEVLYFGMQYSKNIDWK